jgi:hypothetical protein
MTYEWSYPTDAAEDGDYTLVVDTDMSTTKTRVGTVGWPTGAENVEGTLPDYSRTSAILLCVSDNRRSLPLSGSRGLSPLT